MTTNKPEEAMTDRELLELAAKAAGYAGKRVTAYGVVIMGAGYDAEPLYWNPLTDDGDALRLAVKLRLTILWDLYDVDDYVVATPPHTHQGYACWVGQDPNAATRHSIVRVAASIGKEMP